MAESVLFVTGPTERTEPKVLCLDGSALEENRVGPTPANAAGARRMVSCGRETPGHQVRIVDPATGRPCPEDAVGEIWLAGPSIADGYWERPDESRKVFQAFLADSGEGPYLRTGDLGFLHGGELFITGRLKNLIIIRGRNHYPQDIEQTVQQCHPALPPNAGAAFSVETDGEERLVIVQELPREARTWRRDEVALSIRQAVAEQHELTAHAVVLLRPATIPKTTSGKVQHHQCRQRFLTGTLESWEAEESLSSR
jgi:acyl-CoA synthetase (AMP-forming)/AMP-acid ligase II